jgi:hypothetical protein
MFDMDDPVRLCGVRYVGMSVLLCLYMRRRDCEAHPRKSAYDVQQRMIASASAPELSLFVVVRVSKKRR